MQYRLKFYALIKSGYAYLLGAPLTRYKVGISWIRSDMGMKQKECNNNEFYKFITKIIVVIFRLHFKKIYDF